MNKSAGKVSTYGWAPADPAKWPAGCNPHRDGWVRWYKGRSVFVCGKRTPLGEVEDRWIERKRAIDAAESDQLAAPLVAPVRTYRQVLSEFLAAMEHRHETGKPKALSARSLHNYTSELNRLGRFVHDGRKVADMPIEEANRPAVLAAYARQYAGWKASGYDSIISRIGAVFRWAVEMEYVDRYRPGPGFQRPPKQDIRDQRIDLSKSFTPGEVAKLYNAGNVTVRCWVALGVCAGFTNSDVATVTRSVVDLDAGTIDFRRKKTGKVRRVIPLPPDVVNLLKSYDRPEPAEDQFADLFFLTENGTPYSRTRFNGPSCSLNRLFRKLMETANVTVRRGRSFTGLRTTFYNLAPKGGEYEPERKIIMGRARGTIDLDHYLEDVGLERLRHVVNHVWSQVSTSLAGESSTTAGAGTVAAACPGERSDSTG